MSFFGTGLIVVIISMIAGNFVRLVLLLWLSSEAWRETPGDPPAERVKRLAARYPAIRPAAVSVLARRGR